MKLKLTRGILMIVLLMFSSAAEVPLTCSVTQLHDGSFLYHLSRPPSSTQCGTCWESENKTVIARNLAYDQKLVRNLTNQSLTLKSCHAQLHYTRDCKDWEEAYCKINCSLIPEPTTTTVNSTLICITESWCMTKLHFGLGVPGILLLVVCVFVVLHRILKRRRESAASAVSYTPGNVAQDERVDVIIKA